MKKTFILAAFLAPFAIQANAQSGSGAISITTNTPKPAPYAGPKGCPNAMNPDEFTALKNKIAADNDVDDVIELAKKEATSHCFLTQQVKDIMKLLKTDENKFSFFKAVYPHIYDQTYYPSLNDAFQNKSYSDKMRIYVNSLE